MRKANQLLRVKIQDFGKIRHLSSDKMQCIWMQFLNKNEIFFIREREYKVTVYTAKTLRIQCAKGINYTYRIYNNFLFPSKKAKSLLRDVGGIIRLDLLNQYNPFHTISDVFKLTIRTLEKFNKK